LTYFVSLQVLNTVGSMNSLFSGSSVAMLTFFSNNAHKFLLEIFDLLDNTFINNGLNDYKF